MIRKLVSIISTLAIALLGLGQTSPAQAWPDFTVPAQNISVSTEGAAPIPIGKTVNSDAVFVYSEQPNDAGPRFIRSYTVSPSGVISGPFEIITNSQEANYRIDPNDVWVDSSGKFNVVFWSWRSANAGLESILYYTSSSDGVTWNTPQTLENFVGSSQDCQSVWCGIRSVQVAQSPTGTVALTYVETDSASTTKLYLLTKKPGKTWSTRGLLNSNLNIHDSVILKPLGKGWLAVWNFWGNGSTIFSSFSSGDALNTWTTPQLRDSGSCLMPRELMQIAPTKYALVYITGCEYGSPTQTFKYQPFNMLTKQFGTAVTLDSVAAEGGISLTYETQYLAGQSAFGYSVYPSQQDPAGRAKYVLFRNGAPIVQFVNEGAITEGHSQTISGLSMDPLGHLTVVWTGFSGSTISMTLSQIWRGNRSDVNLPLGDLSTLEAPVVFSPDGDVYVSNVRNNKINSVERIRSDQPEIAGVPGVIGKAKVNAALGSKLPTIQPTQLFQTWKTRYQWISCQYLVPETSNLAPLSCNEIANATSSTYKAKSVDKGRYLLVKVTVKSDNSTQVLYSASTSVVK